MKRLVVAAVALLAIAGALAALTWGGGEPPAPTLEDWTKRVQVAARDAAVAEPVTPSLAGGSEARAYAVCYDLSLQKDRPTDCVLASAFVFATPTCPIVYRGLDVPYHQACALDCADGCWVLDGLFARTIRCDEWSVALRGGAAGCNYEMRDGVRFGPDDTDGTPTRTERDAAHAVIEARKAL